MIVETDHLAVDVFTFALDDEGESPYTIAKVHAGLSTTERIVPPAGERYAFDRTDWPVDVQVTVSPTGSSVQVHVNGERVWMHRGKVKR